MAQAKKCILFTMYVRKKHNRSGSTSVVVVSKASGNYKEIKSFGSSTSEEEMIHYAIRLLHGYVHSVISKNSISKTARERKSKKLSVFLAISTTC